MTEDTMNENWQAPVTIRPIGVVESGFRDFSQKTDYDRTSVVRIREDLTDGLIGLEHFSHIYVMYHQNRRIDWQKATGLSRSDEQVLTMPLSGEPTCKGIYTTRTPARPSGIGSCVVELLEHDRNRLTVRGLDAFDGTPVLDIKIYIPLYDSIPKAVAPLHWCSRHDMDITSRLLHWDTMNVGLTLGLRAGSRAMHEIGLARGETAHATVRGGHFFAQGIEGATGCSSMRGAMDFEDASRDMAQWTLRLEGNGKTATVRMHDRLYAGADEVIGISDDILFAAVEVS